jgi:hypothetical protein
MLTSFTIYLNLLIEGKKSSVLVLVFLVVVLLVVLLAQLRVLSLGVFQLVPVVLGLGKATLLQHNQILSEGTIGGERVLLRNQPERSRFSTIPNSLSFDVYVAKIGSEHTSHRLFIFSDSSHEVIGCSFRCLSQLCLEVQLVLLVDYLDCADGSLTERTEEDSIVLHIGKTNLVLLTC